MTKYLKILPFILFVCILPGCTLSNPQYIIPSNKPSNHYYSNKLYSKLMNNSPYTLKIFDMNVYTYYDVSQDEPDILVGFLESLNNDSYQNEIDPNLKPRYKLVIEFEGSKFIINVFNETTVTLYPWDGVYKEDIIISEDVDNYYNLFKFCQYIEKKNKGIE